VTAHEKNGNFLYTKFDKTPPNKARIMDKFKIFTALTYVEQGKAFLNAYWDEISGDSESIWDYGNQFIELDIEKGKEGSDLDEFNAHRFLERLGETKTIKQMRDELRDIDMDFNKRMALIEYLLFKYHKTISDFVKRPQGDNTEELKEAQRQLDEAERALQIAKQASIESDEAAEIAKQEALDAKKAAIEAQSQASSAKISAEEARKRAEEAAAAEAELKQALDDLHQQENEYNTQCQKLKQRSEDQSLGVVQRNKASNELAQLQSQDPLPLRQAKITTEAATKKAEKARLLAEKAHARAVTLQEAAEEARREAERTAQLAEQSRKEAERKAEEARQRMDEAEQAFRDAEAYLEDLKSKPGGGQGAIWWLERDIAEARKYLPKRKQ